MNTKNLSASRPEISQTPQPAGRFRPRRIRSAFGLAWLALSMATAHAAVTMYWDPNISGKPSDGNGTWHTGNVWWNGTSDVAWANGNATVIGSTTPGTYAITLDSTASVAGLILSNNYTINGTAILTRTGGLNPTNGANITINCPLSAPSGNGINLGNNAILTLAGVMRCPPGIQIILASLCQPAPSILPAAPIPKAAHGAATASP